MCLVNKNGHQCTPLSSKGRTPAFEAEDGSSSLSEGTKLEYAQFTDNGVTQTSADTIFFKYIPEEMRRDTPGHRVLWNIADAILEDEIGKKYRWDITISELKVIDIKL